MDVKFTLGLDFPNLPYYIEPNVRYLDQISLKFCIAIDGMSWNLVYYEKFSNKFLAFAHPISPYCKLLVLKVKLTGTNAILRHIARKHNMCGRTEEEMVRVDMAAEQVMDMR